MHAVAGLPRTHLARGPRAAQSAGAPVFAYADVDADVDAVAEAITAGKPAELLGLTTIGTHEGYEESLPGARIRAGLVGRTRDAGRRAVDDVRDPVGEEPGAFKDELWQLDEFAGVSIRDPTTPVVNCSTSRSRRSRVRCGGRS